MNIVLREFFVELDVEDEGRRIVKYDFKDFGLKNWKEEENYRRNIFEGENDEFCIL